MRTQINPSLGPTSSSREQNANLSNDTRRTNNRRIWISMRYAQSKHIFPNKRYSGYGLQGNVL